MSDPAPEPGPGPDPVRVARTDGSHGAGPQGPSPIAGWPGTDEPVAAAKASGTAGEAARVDPDGERPTTQRVLEQASEIAGHVATRETELDRRENNVNSQFSQLDQERRAWRLAVREQEEALAERAEALSRQEQQFEQRLEELSVREAEAESGREELAARRESLAADAKAELDAGHEALAATRQQLEDRATALESEHDTRLEQLEGEFARRGEALRQELTERVMSDELRADRKQLDRDQDEWKRQRESEELELQRVRSEHEQAVRLFEAERSERESNQVRELELTRKSQERELAEAQQSFAVEQESARSEMQQERALMENRHLFQQEHLAKARNTLEADQAVFRQEVQQQRADLARRIEMLDGLRHQLARSRRLLEDRESLLEQGRESFDRKARAAEDSLNQHEQRLTVARETWRKKREEQREEVAGLREHLRSESRALEQRKQRIETLRKELEGSHRESLELRLASEESLARLREQQGEVADDEAAARLANAREAVADHYRQMRETLVTQRADLEDAQKQLAAQVAQQQKIYAEHGERLGEREQVIREQEHELRRQITETPDGESHWRQMQTRWAAEKQQAELIIRDLLKQLGETPAA